MFPNFTEAVVGGMVLSSALALPIAPGPCALEAQSVQGGPVEMARYHVLMWARMRIVSGKDHRARREG